MVAIGLHGVGQRCVLALGSDPVQDTEAPSPILTHRFVPFNTFDRLRARRRTRPTKGSEREYYISCAKVSFPAHSR
jgi:hypothetical protein